MTLAAFADLAEVIGAFGVIAGLVFVGMQLRQNTQQLRRVETNATNSEISVVRQAIFNNGELAEIVGAAVRETRTLDLVEIDRLNALFWEMGVMALQFWDRTRNGLFQREEEYEKAIQSLAPYLTSKAGRMWWQTARRVLRSDFVANFEAIMPGLVAPVALDHATQSPVTVKGADAS